MEDSQLFDPDGVGVDNGTYFGMPFTTEEAELVLISAPWDVTASYGAGTAYGPDAIIEASTQLDFHDPLSPDAWRRGIATADVDYTLQEESQRLRGDAEKVIRHLERGGSPEDDGIVRKIRRVNEGSAAMNANIREQARHWLEKGKTVGLVGGDHSTPYGLIGALGERHEAFGILHIDAHCDLREAYEGFEHSHASIMYNVLRDVPQVTKIVQAGIRDFSRRELEFAAATQRVEQFDDQTLAAAEYCGETWDGQCRRITDRLPEKVYVSFDIDGLTPDNCPHTGTPVPGGLSYNKALWLLETVVRTGRKIIGFDVVEVTPAPEERMDAITGARVLWKLCGLTLKSNGPKKEE